VRRASNQPVNRFIRFQLKPLKRLAFQVLVVVDTSLKRGANKDFKLNHPTPSVVLISAFLCAACDPCARTVDLVVQRPLRLTSTQAITAIIKAVFFLNKPDEKTVQRLIDEERSHEFSYPEVGASRVAGPPGYNIDHNRVRLGEGHDTLTKGIAGLHGWKMFELDWIELIPKGAPIAVGVTVGLLVRHLRFWSLNATRIVYTIEECDTIERYGFAYGTLPGHAECGEERFTIEYHRADQTVWYDVFAFSKPRHILARAGYPISRFLQKRFARESLKAMLNSVNA
jgi:uncharacterized protein (UPF0548 family)